MDAPHLYYRHGLAVLRYVREPPAWMTYDPRADAFVAPGCRLPEIREWAAQQGLLLEGSPNDKSFAGTEAGLRAEAGSPDPSLTGAPSARWRTLSSLHTPSSDASSR